MMKKLIIIILIFLTSIAYAEDKQKINIAVLDFKPQNISKVDSAIITGFFRTALVNTGHFKVIDKNNMDKILEEQGFQQTGCTDQSCAVKIGKILNVKQMIIGSVSKLENVYFISSDIVDVKTAQILDSARVKYKNVDEIEIAIDKLVKVLIKKEKQKKVISIRRQLLLGAGYGLGQSINSNIRVFIQYRNRGKLGIQLNYENYKRSDRDFRFLCPVVLNFYNDSGNNSFYYGFGIFYTIRKYTQASTEQLIDFVFNGGIILLVRKKFNLVLDIKYFGLPEMLLGGGWLYGANTTVISLSLVHKFEF